MAVTVVEVNALDNARGNVKIWDVTFSADADTVSANIPHGFPEAPEEVHLLPRANPCALGLARVTTLDGTNIVLTKSTTAGSLGSIYRLIAKRASIYNR